MLWWTQCLQILIGIPNKKQNSCLQKKENLLDCVKNDVYWKRSISDFKYVLLTFGSCAYNFQSESCYFSFNATFLFVTRESETDINYLFLIEVTIEDAKRDYKH